MCANAVVVVVVAAPVIGPFFVAPAVGKLGLSYSYSFCCSLNSLIVVCSPLCGFFAVLMLERWRRC